MTWSRGLGLLLALDALIPGRGVGQSGDQGKATVGVYVGMSIGQPLWHISRQPLCVLQSVPGGYQCAQNAQGTVNDTLDLRRELSIGTRIGIAATVFGNAHLGGRVALAYVNESLIDQCTPAAPLQPDSIGKNAQVCSAMSSHSSSLGMVSLSGSIVYRLSPHHSMSPYARVGGGIAIAWGETLAASGAFIDHGRLIPQTIVRDSSGETAKPFAELALGVTSGLGVESRIQVDVSDLIFAVQRLLGPADAAGNAPHAGKLVHNLSLTFGIAFVFGAHRERRY